MQQLLTGQHFGANKRTVQFNHCVVSEAGYEPTINVPWHYHENAYLFFHLKGHLKEVNKNRSYHCVPSTILYHNWQDPHYNCEFSSDAQFLHVEFKPEWFVHQDISSDLKGSFHLENPFFKHLLRKLYQEVGINDNVSRLAIEGLLLQVFAEMDRKPNLDITSRIPTWVSKIKEILHDNKSEISLAYLSHETNVHRVHLSREFPRYFGSSFGDYIRNIRLEKATLMLSAKTTSIAQVALECGFADQSHFIRSFKKEFGLTPNAYRGRLDRNKALRL